MLMPNDSEASARLCLALVALMGAGCDSRAVPTGDGGAAGDGAAPGACKSLVALGTTTLGPTTRVSERPAMIHDGTHFAVAWLHGKAPKATNPSTLRFTRVDGAGKAESAAGTTVATAVPEVTPALARGTIGEYGLLFRARTDIKGDVTVMERVGTDGVRVAKPLWLGDRSIGLALTRAGAGYAALVAERFGSSDRLFLARVDAKGSVTREVVHKGGSYWLPWLAPRTGGYAAAWSNTFALLNTTGGLALQTKLNTGMAPSFASAASGHAVAYLDMAGSADNVRLQRIGRHGKLVGSPRVVGGNAGYGAMISRYVALVWTGSVYFVVHSQYASGGASRLVARMVSAGGVPLGKAVPMPMCDPGKQPLVDLAAAWGGGTLAVATTGRYDANGAARLCLSRMRCQP